jgi:SAM-dependent methyltransferase
MSDPQGLAFDAFAADYDRGRWSWPAEMLDGIDGTTVLDLAAGTGKLTALLRERYDEVVAVEPLATMRAILEHAAPEATSLAGTAERIPLDDASVDAVFVANAFHWFDSDAAAREIGRVLRPGGTLVVCWDEWRRAWDIPEKARAAVDEVASRLPLPGGPKAQTGAWRSGFAGAPFTPFAERAHDFTWTSDREGVASYYVSISSMGALPADERAALKERLLDLLPDRQYRLELTARVFTAERT